MLCMFLEYSSLSCRNHTKKNSALHWIRRNAHVLDNLWRPNVGHSASPVQYAKPSSCSPKKKSDSTTSRCRIWLDMQKNVNRVNIFFRNKQNIPQYYQFLFNSFVRSRSRSSSASSSTTATTVEC